MRSRRSSRRRHLTPVARRPPLPSLRSAASSTGRSLRWMRLASSRSRRSSATCCRRARPASTSARRIATSCALSQGFCDEIAHAMPHGFDRDVDRSPAGHDDDGQLPVDGLDARQQVDALASGRRVAGVVEVHQQEVERPGGNGRQGGLRRTDGVDVNVLALEEEPQRIDQVRLVVGDQDARLDGARRVHVRRAWSKRHATSTFRPKTRSKRPEQCAITRVDRCHWSVRFRTLVSRKRLRQC